MSSKTIVRLKITSATHDPEYISEALGVSCERGWRIGENRPNTIIKEKMNGWILNSGLEGAQPLDDQIKSLLKRVEPLRSRMKERLGGDLIELSCVIYADSPPALNFESEVIGSIAALGASLDIDLYV
jgi:hypothetical protein